MNLLRKLIGYPRRQQGEDQVLSSPQENQTESSQSTAHDTSSIDFPAGVEVWHPCDDATLDICFVHGLAGDRNHTWTARGQSTPWPKTLLPPKLPTVRIITYGYDAYVVRKSSVSSNSLIDHADNLLTDLSNNRVRHKAEDRPIIFVAHSLGGLVCKKAILKSRNHPESHLKDIFNCTKGIVFMGTPHEGSWMSDWAGIPARILGFVKSTNLSLLQILRTDDLLLKAIQDDFLLMIRGLEDSGRIFKVACFFEEQPLFNNLKVVSKESATFGGRHPTSIPANHRDMVKFACDKDVGFERLLGELARWEKQIRPLPEQTDGPLRGWQAKRRCDSVDEPISKRRRIAWEKDLQERDDSDDTDDEGSSAFDEEAYDEDDFTDNFAPFSQTTVHSNEDSDSETDW
ncbi:hypothetical protein KXV65_003444 [Aspergillus fumigatus]|nr:hypothetical protein KXX63_004135 [Aspergillus fumigatus]KAH1507693.1 hypothetical protein KXX29_007066 [Aspergillus fumigatus]KAH2021055.1 hypothetical protein KXV65_003444 [Aspergillus fumigatus]KAH2251046.1 hypothetical protein KXW26_003361 [Aspergillus fumigatus]KAH2287353.1 hypothetical protein KXW82_002928 [Aspergillus fumigatus]